MENDNLKNNKNFITTPVAIMVAGLFIALAVFFSGSSGGSVATDTDKEMTGTIINKVTEADHIKGSLDAKVKVVEYSDVECPFCTRFYATMEQIVSEYEEGEVAWVYRHLPLEALHPNARLGALASECAKEQGGNDMFWAYTENLMQAGGVSADGVIALASDMGLDVNDFNACLAEKRYDSKINKDIVDATSAGGSGTPFTVVIAENGRTFTISGAQPYNIVKYTIDLALEQE